MPTSELLDIRGNRPHEGPVASPNPLAQWSPSPNFDARTSAVRFVVLHHTGCGSMAGAMATLKTRNAHGAASAHYLIGRSGEIYQLVAEQHRAWHAGVGSWSGCTDMNSASIGIELDNDGTSAFAAPLVESLLRLLDDIRRRQAIHPHDIIGHADLAPTRKVDPSARFPWDVLASHGHGLWPTTAPGPAPPDLDATEALRVIGYDVSHLPAAIAAFHRHFCGHERPVLMSTDLDLLHNLKAQVRPHQRNES